MTVRNPFLVEGYVSPEYFCDRVDETAQLTRHLTNGCNVALIAERRLGKSGLIKNCFHQPQIRQDYYTFYVDIYETKNLAELVYVLGKSVLAVLQSQGRRALDTFLGFLRSLRAGVTFDINGNPDWGITVGDISMPDVTLDEIFTYLANADRPCLVAIDEFQVIADYPEKTVEAALRRRMQECHNANFVFSGSKRHMMSEIFASRSRPFYNGASIMTLAPINEERYLDFARHHLSAHGQDITPEAFHYLYHFYDGITWYVQYVLNILYSTETSSRPFTIADVSEAIGIVLTHQQFAYKSLLFQLSARQKQLLLALAAEGRVSQPLSKSFLQKYKMTSSMVQSSLKVLLEHDFVTGDNGEYMVYDRFMAQWLKTMI